jgi:hypothetical protein
MRRSALLKPHASLRQFLLISWIANFQKTETAWNLQSQGKSAKRSLLFWDVTQRRLIVICRRFGTTYLSHLLGSLEDRTHRLSRTSVNLPSTLRNIPEEIRSHLHSGGSLKSRRVGNISSIYSLIFSHNNRSSIPSVQDNNWRLTYSWEAHSRSASQ